MCLPYQPSATIRAIIEEESSVPVTVTLPENVALPDESIVSPAMPFETRAIEPWLGL
jgi:hypothetical protein